MCLGNRAEISSHYINDQLRILYENASHCIEKHRNDDIPANGELEFATSLAHFTLADKSASFDFGCPTIEFICNHDAILFLNIKHGRYRLNYKSDETTGETTAENCKVAFRVSLSRCASEKFSCPVIDNRANYTVEMHILDITSAIPLPTLCTGINNEKGKLTALNHWIMQFYLPALKKAGRHVLYSLPDFATTESPSFVDYSVIGTREPTADTVFGVSVNDINKRFHELWSKAEAFVKGQKTVEENSESSFLAQLRISSKVDGKEGYFDLHFGPVHIQALCTSQVILYLDIRDIYVYSGTVAYIADVIEESANFVYINIDTARISEARSTFGIVHDVKVTEVKRGLFGKIKERFLQTMKKRGLHIVHEPVPPPSREAPPGRVPSQQTDTTPEIPTTDASYPKVSTPESPTPTCVDGDIRRVTEPAAKEAIAEEAAIDEAAIRKQILERTRTTPFDLIAALTQASINKHFKSLWESALKHRSLYGTAPSSNGEEFQRRTCIAHFSVSQCGKTFDVEFSAPEIQLVYEERSVILYLHVKKGSLKPLDSENKPRGDTPRIISNWRAAFKLNLEIVDSGGDAKSSNLFNRLKIRGPISYKHIIFSLASAKFISEKSDLLGAEEHQKALEYYIRNYYFPVFERAHHHILFTVPHPQNKSGKGIVHRLFTSLRFEIAPFFTGSAQGIRTFSCSILLFSTEPFPQSEGLRGKSCSRNAIIIIGMTNDAALPEGSIPQGLNWICGGGGYVPLGTVYLSRFLEGILKHLEPINRETTIVPYFWGIDDERWIFELVTWDSHKVKKGKKCSMREVQGDNLGFAWRNKELWRYENDFDEAITYTLDCRTTNELTIPTKNMGECDIQINGTVKIKLIYAEGKADSVTDWSAEITVSWSATISLISTHSGLEVVLRPTQVAPKIIPDKVFLEGTIGYKTQMEALDQLKKVFPSYVDLTPLVRYLKDALEGPWDGVQVDAYEYYLSRPVFNRGGGLVLELVVRDSVIDDISKSHDSIAIVDSGVDLTKLTWKY